MKAGDGEEVGDPRRDKALPEAGINVVTPSQHQGFHDARPRPVQPTNALGNDSSKPVPPGRTPIEHPKVTDAHDPPGVIAPDNNHGDARRHRGWREPQPDRTSTTLLGRDDGTVGDAAGSWCIVKTNRCSPATWLPHGATRPARFCGVLGTHHHAQRDAAEEDHPSRARAPQQAADEEEAGDEEVPGGKEEAGPGAGPVRHRQPDDRWRHCSTS